MKLHKDNARRHGHQLIDSRVRSSEEEKPLRHVMGWEGLTAGVVFALYLIRYGWWTLDWLGGGG